MSAHLFHHRESNDETLVHRAQNGEGAALDLLLERHRLRLHSVVRRLGLSEQEARALLPQVEAKVRQFFGQFEGHCQFAHWIYQVALLMAANFVRERDEPALALPA